jgi:FHA domain-containing protein
MPALVVRDGPSAGHRIEVAGHTVLGRADDALRHDTEAAGRHAVVRTGAGGLEIEDLGSPSGTFVNDERIEGARPLRSGDVIRLGTTTFDIDVEPSAEPTAVPGTATQPPPPPPMPSASGPPPPAPVGSGAPPGSPVYGIPRVVTGARPGAVTAAAIILLTLGIGGVLYNAWDLLLLFGDLELANAFGFGGRLLTLIVIDICLLIAGVLQIVAGIRLFALSRAGRILGIVGSFSVAALWLVSLVLILSWGFVLQAHAWVALAVSVAGSLVAAILLLSSGRHFSSTY